MDPPGLAQQRRPRGSAAGVVGAFYCVSRYDRVAPAFVASTIDREAMSCVGDVDAHRSFCLIVSGIARAFRRGLCDCDRGEIEGAPGEGICVSQVCLFSFWQARTS